MADRATWVERVKEWRGSGQTSGAFSEGKAFTASGLRYWAARLEGGELPRRPRVRLARVVRTRGGPKAVAPGGDRVAEVVVEIGGARVVVRPGVDAATLAAVLEAAMAAAARAG